ncbi:hypothetical protein SAMN05444409_2113 [Epilithonimonas zeae]|uniref:Uncharacterized protein n=1 Tax=Epilithonimonas zeae TaxID=1416779 RepID=A0A1N6GX58_9FLAO|nr:hypothetical protein SAMN05444409_2113 [Epilithonimonas zeae]
MRKFIHYFFCYKKIDVIDPKTGNKQQAKYILFFGLPYKIIYK